MKTKEVIVVSTKMAKTLVVKLDVFKKHPIYHKEYKRSVKFYVHTEDEKKFEEGQKITIVETRPISKLKRWKVLEGGVKELIKEAI